MQKNLITRFHNYFQNNNKWNSLCYVTSGFPVRKRVAPVSVSAIIKRFLRSSACKILVCKSIKGFRKAGNKKRIILLIFSWLITEYYLTNIQK